MGLLLLTFRRWRCVFQTGTTFNRRVFVNNRSTFGGVPTQNMFTCADAQNVL